MRRLLSQSLALSSLVLLCAAGLASSRPRYGGSVRILLRDSVASLDPHLEMEHAGTRDRIASLIFETLTRFDSSGRLKPELALSWDSDPGHRIWRFHLRAASFHDGTAVTAADVVTSLKPEMPDWKITAEGRQTVIVESPGPVHHLPEMLSQLRYAVVKRQEDGPLVGSGPYRLTEWQQGQRALLTANEDYWGGRGYPDSIEFVMNYSLRDHLLERNLGRDAAAELSIDQLRPLEQSSQSVMLSRPSDLLVLLFLRSDQGPGPAGGRKPVDPRIREALADSLNRAATANVLLQRKGSPAGGLLPQWLTGYAFLFPTAADPDRARALRQDVTSAPGIALAYDYSDPIAKVVAERIAVDAREAGITVQPYGDGHTGGKASRKALNADAVLLRLPIRSLEPSTALAALASDLDLPADSIAGILGAARPEDLYEQERKLLADHRVIPVAHVSEALWANGNTHNWQQLADGEWNLDQLWVEGPR